MTTAEIKDYFEHGIWPYSHLLEDGTELVKRKDAEVIIEALLAREADALSELSTAMIHSNPELIFKHTMNAITILNPENEI